MIREKENRERGKRERQIKRKRERERIENCIKTAVLFSCREIK